MEIRMGSLAVPLDRDGREVPATVETMYEDDGTARKVRYLLVDTNAVRDSADGRYEPTQKCWGVYLEGGVPILRAGSGSSTSCGPTHGKGSSTTR